MSWVFAYRSSVIVIVIVIVIVHHTEYGGVREEKGIQ
jgi:hypothetical protein